MCFLKEIKYGQSQNTMSDWFWLFRMIFKHTTLGQYIPRLKKKMWPRNTEPKINKTLKFGSAHFKWRQSNENHGLE